MVEIVVQTPQGPKRGIIQGDSPTAEELGMIKQLFPSSEGETFDYSFTSQSDPVLPASSGTSLAPDEPVPSPEPVGEVEDSWLRFQVGRMDTDEERQNLLNQLLGQGTSAQIDPGTFVIDQARVDPRIREKYGLADTGTIYLDEPGFTSNDFADFAGESGPETIAAIGASLAFTGVGFLPGMALVGLAAGVTKAADEAVEWAQGLNRQSAGDVIESIGVSALMNATFEGAGRVAASTIGRLIKGPGPELSAQRVEELTKGYENLGGPVANKVNTIELPLIGSRARRLGREAAKEEALSAMNTMVRQGARPTIEAAAGKGLSARALAIYEKLFKNPSVGESNYRYAKGVLKQLDEGILDEQQATKLLTENNSQISETISKSLANPDEAFDLSQQHFKDIVSKELAEYEAKFVPSQQLPEEYTKSLQIAATLFKTESGNLYDIAGESIGKTGLFDVSPVIKTLDDLSKDNPFVTYSGSLFKKLKEKAAQGEVSVGELQQLKAALRISRGDTELVSTAAQGGISKLIGSVDDLMKSKQTELAQQVARGYRIETVPSGSMTGLQRTQFGDFSPLQRTQFGDFSPSTGSGVSYRKVDLNPSELENLRRGLSEWDQANAFYMEGQKQFNNTALNTILKSAKDGFFTSNIDVAKVAIQPMNAPRLSMYLQAVTPTKNMAQKLAQPGTTEILENVRRLVDADQFKAAEDLVVSAGLGRTVPKIQGFIDDLPAGDVFRVSQKKAYLQQIDDLAELSRAGTDPQVIRESVRNSLAKTWISQTKEIALDSVNNFNPATFAGKFTSLGDDVQNSLFGLDNAKLMREAMEVFQLSATDRKSAQKLFDALPTLTNQPLKAGIQSVKEVFDRATSESQDAVLSAIKSGNIQSPLELVGGLLNTPNSYNRLKSVVGEVELNKAGGVRDMVMNNLIHNGIKESLESGTIQSGAWGTQFKTAIQVQNKNGALNTILGKETVTQLTKLADNAIKISDTPIAGFGALVQATLPFTLLALIAKGMIIPAATTVGVMLGVSRTLRNPGVLKLLTSPRLRSSEYNKAIKAGADLPSQSFIKNQGRRSPLLIKSAGGFIFNLNRLSNIAMSESSLILGSGILGEIGGEAQKDVTEQYRQANRRLQQGTTSPQGTGRTFPVEPPAPGLSYEDVIRRSVESGNVPGSSKILRQIEMNKLMGVGANQ